MNKLLLGVIAFVLVAGLWVGGTYNGMVSLSEGVQAKWADVETQYQRRGDLVSNLVAVANKTAGFEQETLMKVVEARASATKITIDASKLDEASIQKFQEAQGALGSALSRLIAVSENYPQLTGTQAYRDLMSQLEGTENRIAVVRRDFNGAAQAYNTRIVTFPGNLIASMFNFEKKAYFSADEGAEKAPQIKFQ